jgi:chemotaxis protein MotB
MAELDQVKANLTAEQGTVKSLQGKIGELEQDLQGRQQEIDDLMSKLGTTEEELAELRKAKADREKELETYKKLFARLKKLIDAGTITVVFRKGKMMVAMSSAVLFDSAKAKLKDDAKETLNELTTALAEVNRDFLVAGHTDSNPIKTAKFPSNWELSTQRAIAVVNYMVSQGYPRDKIGAAGYADVDSVGDNATPEGRASNRRIEIILMPNLGELKGIRKMLEGGGSDGDSDS